MIKWLLTHAPTRDVSTFLQDPLDQLHVVATCDCGCFSLYYRAEFEDYEMIADALALYPDGHQQSLMLWGANGDVVWLEVWDMSSEIAHEPCVSALEAGRQLFNSNKVL